MLDSRARAVRVCADLTADDRWPAACFTRHPVHVVLVTEFYYPHIGGITEHVHHLGRYLLSRGHHVKVITNHVVEAPRRPDREWVEGLEIVRIGSGVPVSS